MMMDEYDSGGSFRARSNTWPVAPRHSDLDGSDDGICFSIGIEEEDDSNNQSSTNNLLSNHLGSSNESGLGVVTIAENHHHHQLQTTHHLLNNVVIPTTAHEVASALCKGPQSVSPNHNLTQGQQQLTHQDPSNLTHHDSGLSVSSPISPILTNGGSSSAGKKNTSRRNAWGNMSYADLITQAIQGSPDKRLTLSQIYEWMVQNVPYFKDKGDSNSSAGWKNSIRHNLSLHNRFMRVQNEGTGKSSWWMINPDAKPGKAARRRATSMETSKFEKRRGRVKKKVELMRANGLIPETVHSPSSSVSEGLDHFDSESPLHQFNLSPEGFRPRASSNASSVGGRLSPIPAHEVDMHDSQVPPLSPLQTWRDSSETILGRIPTFMSSTDNQYNPDQLVELATTMKLNGQQLPPTTSYNGQSGLLTTLVNGTTTGSGSGSLSRNGSDPFFQASAGIDQSTVTLTTLNAVNSSPSNLSPAQSMDMINNSSPINGISQPLSTNPSVNKPSTPTPVTNHNNNNTNNHHHLQRPSVMTSQSSTDRHLNLCNIKTSQGRGYSLPFLDSGGIILSRPMAVAVKAEPGQILSNSIGQMTSLTPTTMTNGPCSGPSTSQVMGHFLSFANNTLPNDLDFDSLQGGLECDVNSVIQHELSVDGNLDFNFDGSSSASAGQQTISATAGTNSWVH